MAGYSGTPLIQKIGIKPGHRVVLRNHPASFVKDLGKFPDGAQSSDRLSGKANVVVYFTERLVDLEKDFSRLSAALVPDGMLWISWPQKASGGPTDLTEDVGRRVGLACGLVDVESLRHRRYLVRPEVCDSRERPPVSRNKESSQEALKN
jgi:hypothetical protein